MIDKAREVALKALYKINEEDGYSNIVVKDILKENQNKLNPKDIAFISELVYGTVTWKLTIDEIISKYSSIRIKKISPWIVNILRMGIYQIVFLDKVPKSAAVNEAVNLSKKYGGKSLGFVNAILRKVEKVDYEKFEEIEDGVKRISLTTSMPVWIIEELLREKSFEETEKICKASNIKPKVAIRVNKLLISKDKLVKRLEEKEIMCEDGILEDFLVITNVKNIEKLEEFQEGFFTVQDEVAGLSSYLLGAKKGEKILDACSAPGGKTTYIAEIIGNEGSILAFDLHNHRLELVEKNCERLKIKIVETRIQDMTVSKEEYFEKFDKILLDVPCLGIGVLKRKPDIKWKKKKEDIEAIIGIQKQILTVASRYLKKGGEMIYSTCSIFSEENEKIIEEFIEKNTQYRVIELINDVPNFFEEYLEEMKYLKVNQNERTDGFFISKIKKL